MVLGVWDGKQARAYPIDALKKAGVEVFVCGQSLHELGFKAEEVAGEVPVADSAMLVLVNKQTDGYAYLPAR